MLYSFICKPELVGFVSIYLTVSSFLLFIVWRICFESLERSQGPRFVALCQHVVKDSHFE